MDSFAYSFDSISLLPRKTHLSSRSKADVSQTLGNRKFKLPVVPSNMLCVIDENIAKFLSEEEYFYIMHRYDVDIESFVRIYYISIRETICVKILIIDSCCRSLSHWLVTALYHHSQEDSPIVRHILELEIDYRPVW